MLYALSHFFWVIVSSRVFPVLLYTLLPKLLIGGSFLYAISFIIPS